MNGTVKDLFIQIYDLSPLDMDILFMLIANNREDDKPMTLDEVSEEVTEIEVLLSYHCKNLLP